MKTLLLLFSFLFPCIFFQFGDGAKLPKFTLIKNLNGNDFFPLENASVVESYRSSVRNLTEISSIVWNNEVTHYAVEGMWVVFFDANYERNSPEGIWAELTERGIETTDADWSAGRCKTWRVGRKGKGVIDDVHLRIPRSIRQIGNVDAESVGLSFYTKANFGGEELYFAGNRLILPSIIHFHSYGYTLGTSGKHFQVFQNQRFEKDSKSDCLRGKDYSKNANAFEPEKSILVGSIAPSNCTKLSRLWDKVYVKECMENQSRPFDEENKKIAEGLNRYHSAGVSTPSLILWTVERAMLFMDGSELRLPFTHDAVLAQVYGNRNFTIYSNPDFGGKKKCIVADEHRDCFERYGRYGDRTNLVKQTFKVRSVRRGCENDPVPLCGLTGYEYEILGYKTDDQGVLMSNSEAILKCKAKS